MRKLLCAALAAMLLCGLRVPVRADGLDNFARSDAYTPGQFSDVAETDWFAGNVQCVYEYGIMNGVSEDRFDAGGPVTAAQAIAIACRLHQTYHGTNYPLDGGTPWYGPYVEYARRMGIVGGVDDATLNAPIERCGFAMILSAALPDEALPEINSIPDGTIPDVCDLYTYSDPVYRLYRAGVLSGNDGYGTFTPYTDISRSAAAAVVSRMIRPELRVSVSLAPRSFEPVPIDRLYNRKSLQKSATDAEFAQAYEAAREIVAPIAYYDREDQLLCIAVALRERFENGMTYSMEAAHYNDPYGYFILGSASCAGCTRATGLCLSMLGIPYEHVNENQYSHQWCRVNVDGVYWICDAYGLYCGPEPAPYQHPYL